MMLSLSPLTHFLQNNDPSQPRVHYGFKRAFAKSTIDEDAKAAAQKASNKWMAENLISVTTLNN